MSYGDVFMCNSPSESYGVAWLEMLAVGMLGVFEKAWWNETLLPDWYPFVTDSHDQQVQMAAALLKQWPDGPLWSKYSPMVREWIRTEHNEQSTGQRLAALLDDMKQNAILADGGKGTGSVGQLAVRAAELAWAERGSNPAVHEDEVWRRMAALSDSGREWGKSGDIVSRMYLRRCLEANGWRDICRSHQVEFVAPHPGTPSPIPTDDRSSHRSSIGGFQAPERPEA
jgi:hypothetical protein